MSKAPAERNYDLEALEFVVVRNLLAERLTTTVGRAAVEALAPLADAAAARAELAAVGALAAAFATGQQLPLSGAVEVRSWLGRFAAGEHVLQAKELAELKRLLRAGERCRLWCLAKAGPLAEFAAPAPDLEDLVAELEQIVDDRGEILDSASPKLRALRAEIEQARLAVDGALTAVLASAEVRKHLQAAEPVWRHGRPVLQVKAEFRHKVPGVLHDRSASGATLFVEPEAVVEAANRLSDAQAAEHRERNVVLADAARGLRRLLAEIQAAVWFVGAADLLAAKARLCVEDGYTVPEVVEDGPLRLRSARHPLLQRGAAAQSIVPLDLALGDPNHLLVVTGPAGADGGCRGAGAGGRRRAVAVLRRGAGRHRRRTGDRAEPVDVQFPCAAHHPVPRPRRAPRPAAARRARRGHRP